MSPDIDPTATISFQHVRAGRKWLKEIVWEQASHPTGSPLTTLTSRKSPGL